MPSRSRYLTEPSYAVAWLGAAQRLGVRRQVLADNLDRAIAERLADVGHRSVEQPAALVDQQDPVAQDLRVHHVVRAHDHGRAAIALLQEQVLEHRRR